MTGAKTPLRARRSYCAAPRCRRRCLSTTRSGGALNFRWPSAGGLSYQLQSATNLPATIWFNEGPPFPGTGGTVGTNLSLGPEPKRFFRLQIEN